MNSLPVIAPLPLEILRLPDHLDGRDAINRRNDGCCQISAARDTDAIQCWLAEYHDSPQTFRSYRKEAERLLLWAVISRQKPLSGLRREDFQDYQHFLADPQPEAFWCGPRAERHRPQWRPFQGALSENSQRQAMTVINALLSWLVGAGYLNGNPLSLIRRRRKLRPQTGESLKQERFFDQATWRCLQQYLESIPRESARQRAVYERTRFLFTFLYLLAPPCQ